MSKLSWAVVCCLVIFNSAALVADFNFGVKGAGCDPKQCAAGSITFNECYHENTPDEGKCLSNVCIVNVISTVECPGESGNSECDMEDKTNMTLLTQYYRKSRNCSYTNQSYQKPKPGDCQWWREIQIRCETTSCSGQLYDDTSVVPYKGTGKKCKN